MEDCVGRMVLKLVQPGPRCPLGTVLGAHCPPSMLCPGTGWQSRAGTGQHQAREQDNG